MSFSVDDKVKKLVGDPRAKAVLEKHHPKFLASPSLPLTYGMTYKSLAAFPQAKITPEMLEAIEAELKEIED